MIFEIKIPDIGVDEFEVTEIFIKVGDIIKENQSLITIEGDKTSLEIPSTVSGIVKEIKVNIGDNVKTDHLIVLIENINIKKTIQNENTLNLIKKKNYKKNEIIDEIYASPLIRSLSRKFNIDLKKIKGSGLKGRIVKEDIEPFIKNGNINNFNKNSKGFVNNLDIKKNDIEKVKISNLQLISGKNLFKSWITIPHVTIFDKIDITDLEIFRKKQNKINFKKNIKFTPLVFVIKAVAIALKCMPKFNSSISENGKYLNIKKKINIGIAVETNKGLLVPIIKNVKNKNITQIAKLLVEISNKARDGFLSKNDINNGTFTISSLGHIGTKNFTPIINAPEVAIIGISRSYIEPIWNGKNFIPKLILPISLSFDHRVIDGADGARFIKKINFILSDIRNLII